MSDVTPTEKLKQLETIYENYVRKNGNDEKAKELSEKIGKIRKSLYESDTSYRFHQILKEEADRAETIMTAKGLLDDILGHQAKIGEMLNQYIDPFSRMVNNEYGVETSESIRNDLSTALENVLSSIAEAKEKFYDAVNVLTGESEIDDMVVSEPDMGSLEDEEDDSLDMDDLESTEEPEEDEEDDSGEGIDLDLDLDDSDFERKEE